MELDVDVLGVRAHLWDFGNFESAAVVLKDSAMDRRLGRNYIVALSLELFDKLHDRDCGAECGRQTDELALCGAERYFRLELRCP